MNKTVNIAKGLSIIAMVVGHAVPHDTLLATFIYKWHMPLFFFFSGYFFSVDKYSFGKFVYRKIKSLYIPFVIWSLLLLSIHNVLIKYHISDGNIIDLHTFKLFAFRIICQMRQYEPLLGTFWFLIQLLFVNFFVYLVYYLKKKTIDVFISNTLYRNFVDVFIILLLVVGSIVLCKLNVLIYFHFSYITLLSMSFFIIGNKLRMVDLIRKRYFISSVLIVVCFGNTFHEMIDLKSDYILTYLIVAVFGIIFIYDISKILDMKCKYINVILAYVGDKSLSIMILHFTAFKIISYMIIQNEGLSINTLSSHPVIENVQWYWTVLYILIGVTIPLFLERCYSSSKSFVLSKFNNKCN